MMHNSTICSSNNVVKNILPHVFETNHINPIQSYYGPGAITLVHVFSGIGFGLLLFYFFILLIFNFYQKQTVY